MDKRYRFIRSKNPFESLDDYKTAPYFRLKEKSRSDGSQKTLFYVEKKGKGEDLRPKEGDYFEKVATCMYGGIKKLTYVNSTKDNGNCITIEPDLYDAKKGILHEIKGIQKSSHVKLDDEQIAKYVLLQSRENFPNPPRIRYEIFGHGINKLQREYNGKSLESMVEGLSESIRYFISLPFSLVFEFYSQDDKNYSGKQFTSRHNDEKTFKTLTRLNASALNNLIAYPEEVLKAFDLEPQRFEIEKRRFPKTFTFNGNVLQPFPMLFIYDKEYSKFISELPDRINSDKKIYERIHKNSQLLNEEELYFTDEEWGIFNPKFRLEREEIPY